jgi:aminoglycoside phosphotransferase family enzyme/predicted kinase
MPDSVIPSTLAEALCRASTYPHAVERIQMIETHISWVFLTGAYAYKVRKPVKLGFLDFSTLEARRHDCVEELRLNRRLAPELYLEVVAIRASPEGPRVGGSGVPIEYAVRMRQFPQAALATGLLAAGALTPELITSLAWRISAFHAGQQGVPADSRYGDAESILRDARGNFEEIGPLLDTDEDRVALEALRDWTEREFIARHSQIGARHEGGSVRECHGDLHLRNIVLLGDRLVPFDCLEFSAALRWNDVMSEAAFVAMDLMHLDAPRLAWLFLNAYVEAGGDYAGLSVLRFYMVYRALVRAKIHLIRARQACSDPAEAARLVEEYHSYVRLAAECSSNAAGAIVLMHGLSGSGKSTVARELSLSLAAIRVRSDVERKRLPATPRSARGGSARARSAYTPAATEATYARLAEAAGAIAQAGYTAIVDAAFLAGAQRKRFRDLARTLDVPVALVDLYAPAAVLRERIARRAAQARDPSEATLDVLEHQIATAEPIARDEHLSIVSVDGCVGLTPRAVTALCLLTCRHCSDWCAASCTVRPTRGSHAPAPALT